MDMKDSKWEVVPDNKIQMVWRCTEDDCEEHEEVREAVVYPDFYQDNGTPVCGCGCDMEYIETLVNTA